MELEIFRIWSDGDKALRTWAAEGGLRLDQETTSGELTHEQDLIQLESQGRV